MPRGVRSCVSENLLRLGTLMATTLTLMGAIACGPPSESSTEIGGGVAEDAPAGAGQAAGAEPEEAAAPKREVRVHSTVVDLERLRSLGYVSGTFDPRAEHKGVLVHDTERAYPGYNFFSSRDLPAAFLIDMEGRIVHRWARRQGAPWQHVDLLPDGRIIALVKNSALLEVDFESRLLWQLNGTFHHDLWRGRDGTLYVLSRKSLLIPEIHPRHHILVDYVSIVSPDGKLEEEYSILELLQNSSFRFMVPSLSYRDFTQEGESPDRVELDILHANHVELLEGRPGSPFPEKGRVLLSLRNLNTILVADLVHETVVWAWGPSNLIGQHDPTLLSNGHFLIFNNGYQRSAVLELDPKTYQIVWSYGGDPEFFSASRGSNQRLPNGNTLITESDTGYVFEVTPSGDTVWEFANFQVDDENVRSAIWRMVRFSPQELAFFEKVGS